MAVRKAAAAGEHLTQRKRLAKMKQHAGAANTFTILATGWVKRKDAERGPHVVPLPPVLLAMLRPWRAEDGPGTVYMWQSPPKARRPIAAEAVEKHYRDALDLSGKHSPHSWRFAFSAICRDAGRDVVARLVFLRVTV